MSTTERIVDMAERISHDAMELGGEVLMLREIMEEIRQTVKTLTPAEAVAKIRGILDVLAEDQ